MAHIHFGPPGLTGAPLLALYDYGVPPSKSLTANTLTGTLTPADFMPDSVDGISTWAQAVTQIETGRTYVNIHSTNFPAGEIRGQIVANPEPATCGLLLIGVVLTGVVGQLRRTRKP
jgi:hypothetical protein